MLAVIDRLATDQPRWEFVALAPAAGGLAQALQLRDVRHLPLDLCDQSGRRHPPPTATQILTNRIEQAAPDLVHANSLSMGRLSGAIARSLDIPCVAHLRDIMRLSRAAIEDMNCNQLLLAVSQATKEYHVAQGLFADKTRVLYNGVDCKQFQPRPAQGILQRELSFSAGSFLVATIGQIGLRKGQDVLADAARLVSTQLPQVHYLLVGERYSNKRESVEFEARVVRQFDDAGLGGRLHVLGYRDDVHRLMNEVDLLVHPARQEPLGRVLLEAAASGLPIVATDVGGTREMLNHGQSAVLVPPDDPESLAKAIRDLANDADERRRLAQAARERVETAFNIQQSAEELARIWTECC